MRTTHSQLPRTFLALVIASLFVICTPLVLYASSQEHIVQPGESLLQIAADYNVSVAALMTVNQIANENLVTIGETLVIPSESDLQMASTEATSDESNTVDSAQMDSAEDVTLDEATDSDFSAQSASEDPAYVIVQPGESLGQIALRYGMNSTMLMALNGLTNPNLVQAGQRLRVANADGTVTSMEEMLPNWDADKIHVVQPGESLGQIAQLYGVRLSILMRANHIQQLGWVEVGQKLIIPQMPDLDLADVDYTNAPPEGQRLLEVDLTGQWMTAWDGHKVFMHTLISSGLPDTPTVLGHYAIYSKLEKQDMNGFNGPLPDVPWVMYFFEGFSFHGAYWHNNFGVPMSHGCVHLPPELAKKLYDWTDMGTQVYVHW
ncbi:MAG: LysM peptidoglycan-binding domain-containing protein [Caldilineaceae bacterium]